MAPASDRSTSTQLSSTSRSARPAKNMQSTSVPSSPSPPIAALPSLSHSLSSFPTMTSVTKGMVHYGMSSTKSISEAKLQTALNNTKQRQAGTSGHQDKKTAILGPAYSWSEDEDVPLTMTKGKRAVRRRRPLHELFSPNFRLSDNVM
ncbi:uncharacterized protein LAESUDRAFT_720196, partial [Laetiporus sulphureus 93-53]